MHVINPDDFLETEEGRVFTPERNAQAWASAYASLEAALSHGRSDVRLFVVMGVQGAGKSTWIERHRGTLGENAVVFDAAVPAARHRDKLLAIAKRYNVAAIAVWVQSSLEDALRRNRLRTPDEQVPEEAIRSVYSLLEAPSVEEGFSEVRFVLDDVGG